MAKIAVECAGEAAARDAGEGFCPPVAHLLARGEGWVVSDIVCRAGPHSRPFEERHACPAIAIVVAGTFQYRAGAHSELMTPGSLMLGNAGQSFECGHQHGAGDRCISFAYTPEFFARLTADVGTRHGSARFRTQRLPPVRMLAPFTAAACAALDGSAEASWEQFSIQLAAHALRLDRGLTSDSAAGQPSAIARVTRVVRMIERHFAGPHDLASLAREARLSPFHFLRVFEELTGVTPHQYLLRMRLRHAAMRLTREFTRVLDIALDSGFGDVSNFNRTFRAEFGVSPRAYRIRTRRARAAG